MPVLDLTETIRRKLASTDLADPREIAEALIEDGDVPSSQYREALLVTLPHFVREQIRFERTGSRGNHRAPDTHGTSVAPPVRSGHSNRSSRWESANVYGLRVFTGTEWKLLGSCTWQDVEAIVDEYARREATNGRMRLRYETVLGLRVEYPRVRSLKAVPADRLDEILHADAVSLARIREAQRLRGAA